MWVGIYRRGMGVQGVLGMYRVWDLVPEGRTANSVLVLKMSKWTFGSQALFGCMCVCVRLGKVLVLDSHCYLDWIGLSVGWVVETLPNLVVCRVPKLY